MRPRVFVYAALYQYSLPKLSQLPTSSGEKSLCNISPFQKSTRCPMRSRCTRCPTRPNCARCPTRPSCTRCPSCSLHKYPVSLEGSVGLLAQRGASAILTAPLRSQPDNRMRLVYLLMPRRRETIGL